MRKKIYKLLYAMVPLVITVVVVMGNIMAANVPYNMEYSGGDELKNVVIENESLINSLTPLVAKDAGITVTPIGSKWIKNVYKNPNATVGCEETYALEFTNQNKSNVVGSSFKVSGADYDMTVEFEDVSFGLVGSSSMIADSDKFTVSITPRSATIGVGYRLFSDASCQNASGNYRHLDSSDGIGIFVKTHISLKRRGQTSSFSADGVYFRLSDIDAAQSYKVLNAGNELTPNTGSGGGNMYAKSKANLSPTSGSLKNKFNSNYIYSQFSGENFVNCSSSETNGCTDANIYVPLSTTTQTNGLDIVFGFANSAGSAVEFYAKQFEVKYESDPNGTITNITSEDVVSGSNPTGSDQEPSAGYKFKCWTADKDVTLSSNGARIPAGNCIRPDQVVDVVVEDNLTFTAIHELEPEPTPTQYTVEYESDEHGEIIGIESEEVDENDNPTGSEQKPEEGYKFVCWRNDVAVSLENGETKEADSCLTDEELKEVIVTQDVKFTAIHEPVPGGDEDDDQDEDDSYSVIIPDTGASTGEINAIIFPVSILSIISVVLISLIPRLFHKKIGFNKK